MTQYQMICFVFRQEKESCYTSQTPATELRLTLLQEVMERRKTEGWERAHSSADSRGLQHLNKPRCWWPGWWGQSYQREGVQLHDPASGSGQSNQDSCTMTGQSPEIFPALLPNQLLGHRPGKDSRQLEVQHCHPKHSTHKPLDSLACGFSSETHSSWTATSRKLSGSYRLVGGDPSCKIAAWV